MLYFCQIGANGQRNAPFQNKSSRILSLQDPAHINSSVNLIQLYGLLSLLFLTMILINGPLS